MDVHQTALSLADAAAMLALTHAYDERYFGEEMTDLADVETELAAPSLDLARDTVGCRVLGGLVGYALINARARVELAVGAEGDAMDLRERLNAWVERVAGERGLAGISQFVARGDASGAEFLAARGYALHHTSWVLQLDAGRSITGRELPTGYAVRPFREEDAEQAFVVVRDAFAEWEEGPERSFEDWSAHTVMRTGVDPGAFRVATYDGRVVGASIVFDSGDEAWVQQLAVAKDHRSRGIAQQLLAETYRAARERGVPQAGLATDTRTGALDLYLRLGMSVRHTIDNWSLALQP